MLLEMGELMGCFYSTWLLIPGDWCVLLVNGYLLINAWFKESNGLQCFSWIQVHQTMQHDI
jgi:hypothetical protein